WLSTYQDKRPPAFRMIPFEKLSPPLGSCIRDPKSIALRVSLRAAARQRHHHRVRTTLRGSIPQTLFEQRVLCALSTCARNCACAREQSHISRERQRACRDWLSIQLS